MGQLCTMITRHRHVGRSVYASPVMSSSLQLIILFKWLQTAIMFYYSSNSLVVDRSALRRSSTRGHSSTLHRCHNQAKERSTRAPPPCRALTGHHHRPSSPSRARAPISPSLFLSASHSQVSLLFPHTPPFSAFPTGIFTLRLKLSRPHLNPTAIQRQPRLTPASAPSSNLLGFRCGFLSSTLALDLLTDTCSSHQRSPFRSLPFNQ